MKKQYDSYGVVSGVCTDAEKSKIAFFALKIDSDKQTATTLNDYESFYNSPKCLEGIQASL